MGPDVGDRFEMLGIPAMVRLSVAVAVLVFASSTCTLKLSVPMDVGVPEIAPVLALSDRPAGKPPELIDHVYGPTPPLAAKVTLYAMFCEPLLSEVVVTASGA
jgi:hypothetical protein